MNNEDNIVAMQENYIHKLFGVLMEAEYPGVSKMSQDAINIVKRDSEKSEKFLLSLKQLSPELFDLYGEIQEGEAEMCYLNGRDSFTAGFEWGAGLNKQLGGSEND